MDDDRASLHGRVLVAALLTSFAMWGYAGGPLHRFYGDPAILLVVLGPFIGALIAKAFVGEECFDLACGVKTTIVNLPPIR